MEKQNVTLLMLYWEAQRKHYKHNFQFLHKTRSHMFSDAKFSPSPVEAMHSMLNLCLTCQASAKLRLFQSQREPEWGWVFTISGICRSVPELNPHGFKGDIPVYKIVHCRMATKSRKHYRGQILPITLTAQTQGRLF